MLAASRRKPHLITQVVPSPFTFKADRVVRELLADGYLGNACCRSNCARRRQRSSTRPALCTGGRTEK